jgi:hypothetical protein
MTRPVSPRERTLFGIFAALIWVAVAVGLVATVVRTAVSLRALSPAAIVGALLFVGMTTAVLIAGARGVRVQLRQPHGRTAPGLIWLLAGSCLDYHFAGWHAAILPVGYLFAFTFNGYGLGFNFLGGLAVMWYFRLTDSNATEQTAKEVHTPDGTSGSPRRSRPR